jgi:hypothetical protein
MQKKIKTDRSTLTLRRETMAQITGGGRILVPHPNPEPASRYCNASNQYCGRW